MRRSAGDDVLDKRIRPKRVAQQAVGKILFTVTAITEEKDSVVLIRFELHIEMPINSLDKGFDGSLLRHCSYALGRLARQQGATRLTLKTT